MAGSRAKRITNIGRRKNPPRRIAAVLVVGLLTAAAIVFGIHQLTITSANYGRAVILVSLDGFRHDYIYRGLTPTLERLANEGIMGSLQPQFPSYTFPNHHSLVTGRYPTAHGIVSNVFYDPSSQKYFYYHNSSLLEPTFWQGAEPIWNLAERKGLRTASVFWPGSEVLIGKRRPSHFRPYNGSVGAAERVDQLLEWLDSHQPSLTMLYLSEIDQAGHHYGTTSKELDAALASTDRAIARLLEGLEVRGLGDQINLVLVSDHGMVDVPRGQRIFLDLLVPNLSQRIQWIDYGPVTSIIPSGSDIDSLVADLEEASLASQGAFKVYRKEALPPHWHYSQSDRVAPLLLVCQPGWTLDRSGSTWDPRGNHGYAPETPEMRAILIAKGPQIQANSQSFLQPKRQFPPVSNLDVFPLLAAILGVTPEAPHNGTQSLVQQLLIK